MADTLDNARNELVYVSASEPADESAKRLPSEYIVVGLLTSNSVSTSRNMIAANNKSSGDGENDLYGRISGSLSVSGQRAKDGNAGMKIIRDALANKQDLWVLVSDNTVDDEAVHGKFKVTSYDEGSDDESTRTASAELKLQGEPSFFTIQT